jgi:UDP-N-acetylmuramoyl-L-alanyl-D-glutamate--2,6-diaminopimelate ligase
VTGFAIDHRKVAPGTVFGAFRGGTFNGEDFIPAAVAGGAVAVVARPEAVVHGAVHVAHREPRRAFAQLAARFFVPVPETIVAVTGTNGKTSTVEMTRQLWRMGGERAASIGTLGVTTPDESVSTGLTTPGHRHLPRQPRRPRPRGRDPCRLRGVQPWALAVPQRRCAVRAGAFTNLSRDHLDYHATMDDYFAAKMRLFDEVVGDNGAAVIWADDAGRSRRPSTRDGAGLTVISVGEKGDTLKLTGREPTQLGQTLRIEHHGTTRTVQLPLIGAYQAANALIAAGLVLATGGEPAQVFDALAGCSRCADGSSALSSPGPERRSMSTTRTLPTPSRRRSRRCGRTSGDS